MAKTLNQIIDSIKIDLKVFVDDHWLANLDEFLADKIMGINQTLIRKEFREIGFADEIYYQVHNCLEVTCHHNTCVIDNITFNFKGDLYKVEYPKLLTGIGDQNIKYFGLMDMMTNFDRGSFDSLRAISYRRYSSDEPVYTTVSNYALIRNLPKNVARLTMIGLFSDFTDPCTFNVETDMYPTPSEYNLELLVKKDLLSTWNIPFEEKNDTRGIVLVPSNQKQPTQTNEQ
jgi:hypothetical protein